MTAEPDLRKYPFDNDTLSIRMEPRFRTGREMVFVINKTMSGMSNEARLSGWEFTTTGSSVMNNSYYPGETPYSRVTFDYGIKRDVTSTILKFFLPVMLILIVSFSSLMMKSPHALA